ncbi:glutamine synthetase [Physcia stellaris]|nr:glutamine synthetase [Physcia stellaris]
MDPNAAGTGSHVHVSMTPPEKHKNFLAGILKYLPAIAAFTYSNDVSYESYGQRMVRSPYLVLDAVIDASVQGVLDFESLILKDCLDDPAKPSDDDRRSLGILRQSPRSFNEAMSSLEEDAWLRSILGDPVCDTQTAVKREESKMIAKMKPDGRRS